MRPMQQVRLKPRPTLRTIPNRIKTIDATLAMSPKDSEALARLKDRHARLVTTYLQMKGFNRAEAQGDLYASNSNSSFPAVRR
jgi:hypothetical protein